MLSFISRKVRGYVWMVDFFNTESLLDSLLLLLLLLLLDSEACSLAFPFVFSDLNSTVRSKLVSIMGLKVIRLEVEILYLFLSVSISRIFSHKSKEIK